MISITGSSVYECLKISYMNMQPGWSINHSTLHLDDLAKRFVEK